MLMAHRPTLNMDIVFIIFILKRLVCFKDYHTKWNCKYAVAAIFDFVKPWVLTCLQKTLNIKLKILLAYSVFHFDLFPVCVKICKLGLSCEFVGFIIVVNRFVVIHSFNKCFHFWTYHEVYVLLLFWPVTQFACDTLPSIMTILLKSLRSKNIIIITNTSNDAQRCIKSHT